MTLHKHAVFCTIRQKTDVELWLLNGFAPNKLLAIRGRLICFKNTLIGNCFNCLILPKDAIKPCRIKSYTGLTVKVYLGI